MRWRLMTVLVLLGLSVGVGAKADEQLPPPVVKGLKELQEGRCREVFEQWTTHWKSEQDVLKRQQLLSTCDLIAQIGGPLHGYTIITVVNVTPYLRRAYIVLRYEKQPL